MTIEWRPPVILISLTFGLVDDSWLHSPKFNRKTQAEYYCENRIAKISRADRTTTGEFAKIEDPPRASMVYYKGLSESSGLAQIYNNAGISS